MTYVVDTSVIARMDQPAVLKRLQDIGTWNCRIPVVVVLEYGVGARDFTDHRYRLDLLQGVFTVVPASPWAQEHAMNVQAQLAIRGFHRSARLADLLIAATATQLDATVLHYDRDFDTVASVTGQPMEWVAPSGTLDGQASG